MKKAISTSFFIFIIMIFFSSIAFAKETSILNGIPITGEMDKNTYHTYKFTANKDGEAYITLDQAKAGFYIRLIDSNGKIIGYDYFRAAGGKAVVNKDLEKGTYYLKIEPYNWNGTTNATYRVKATYSSSFNRNAATFETNDTAETSMNIGSGSLYRSTAETNVDRDVYQFTTNKDGEVYITLDETKAGFYIQLFDSNGNRRDYDYFSSAGGKAVINKDLEKGTYYLYIDPYNWSGTTSASYRVKATYSAAFKRNPTTFEPNDTAETSLQMISNKLYYSNSYSVIDRDVYRFTANNDGKAVITLDQTKAGFYIQLFDSNGNRKAYDYFSSAGGKAVLDVNLEKGTYYVYIDPYNWRGTTSASYRVKASFKDKAPSVDPIYDTGTVLTGKAISNTKVYAQAGAATLGKATAQNGKFSIKIPKQKAGTKIGVYTVDSAGNISATRTATVINAAIKAASAGYNKIKVSWNSVPGSNGYEVYRSTSSTRSYSRTGTVTSGKTVSFTDSKVTTGKTYYYKVRAYRVSSGKKEYSPYTRYISGKAIPSAPAGLAAKKSSKSSMGLSWRKVDGSHGYRVYRSTSRTGTYSLAGTVKSGNKLSYTSKNLKKGSKYYYKVRAYRTVSKKNIYSNYSSILTYKN